jgi:hypothetical protein
MFWSDIRKAYPNQWLIVEAVEAHTTLDKKRQLERLAVIDKCADGKTAFQTYRRLHEKYPQREFYFLHTAREDLDIREQHWQGIRRNYAAHSEG